jgi:hypothetical protein
MEVRLSALLAGLSLNPRKIRFLLEVESTSRVIVQLEESGQLKNQ